MSLTGEPKPKERDPPALSFASPSPGISRVSLSGSLNTNVPALGRHNLKWDQGSVDAGGAQLRSGSEMPSDRRPEWTLPAKGSYGGTDRTDALWAEMQATLEKVELSASEGTHVFGPEHDRKLAELRTAQIVLAQAWARSEADDTIETALRDHMNDIKGDEAPNLRDGLLDSSRPDRGEGTDAAKSMMGTSSGWQGSDDKRVDRLGAKLVEETEADILLARKRREANDEYFERVNDGVIDVIAKLESVAVAMRAVEEETKDLWNDA
ncbi:hypothetical protein BBK36DRAFT_1123831 [Trichoderma citrinoviride]|uniref:Uncharacterized protein n=1 Tax=Trichoderma citrinoviride TaxID=58853 RepID=A0A2T4B3Z9_9HYPO|nr:hypothetical protein BBK36DRAFT_1123831 [Trichoderma citrinoviride]PTB64053.1 hypothetical protein BBK36DRAFT_1123831 [Trichoderma citrinoviride]